MYKDEKSETKKPNGVEYCPECGSYLIKKQGCTQCSDPYCIYEKCSI